MNTLMKKMMTSIACNVNEKKEKGTQMFFFLHIKTKIEYNKDNL